MPVPKTEASANPRTLGRLSMDKDTRNAIERATQRARKLLEADFAEQLEGTYDVLLSGNVAASGGPHLTARQRLLREKIVAALEHKRAGGMMPAEAAADYRRDAAFTALNRFVALKMLESRELVQECISKGMESTGYREFCGLAPGVALLPNGSGYRMYLECIFDELSTEVKVLFDRRDVASVLWPRRSALESLLEVLNGQELSSVWSEDETIGWVYQYFNFPEERRAMRDASQAPRNSRELAVRNQFFTPRYVVQFLTDNTLGRIWYEMHAGQTGLVDSCEYMVRRPEEKYQPRVKKDPRDLRILDPACGSGHFLLYAFELLLVIYLEGWADADAPRSEVTGKTLREDYPSLETVQRGLPGLILRHNLHGVDIDPRCAQIAQLALWMRAQRALRDFGIARADRLLIRRANIVIAEPMPGEADLRAEFLSRLGDSALAAHFEKLVDRMKLAGELGLLLRVEELVQSTRKGETGNLFAAPAERIHSALALFGKDAVATQQARRRLFLDDSAQGLGLVELAEKRFEVVLMNPPFGDGSAGAKKDFEKAYPKTKNDIYAAFVERGVELLHSRGRLGAITSRTGFFLSTFQRWREEILLAKAPPAVFADLGYGVLDSAMVETAAYCLELRP
jgi:Eco57I restriction-modification methylase